MKHYCVVVADATLARFYTLESPAMPELESGPNLVEKKTLKNPEGPDKLDWTEDKSGRNRAPGGGPAHGYDDHRQRHEKEAARRFANVIADECARMKQSQNTTHVVLVASKEMLGQLRRVLEHAHLHVSELPRDLTKLAPRKLHEHLARARLVPERRDRLYA